MTHTQLLLRDPAKVVRVALENAASVAGVLLLADGTLTEVEEPEKGLGHELRED